MYVYICIHVYTCMYTTFVWVSVAELAWLLAKEIVWKEGTDVLCESCFIIEVLYGGVRMHPAHLHLLCVVCCRILMCVKSLTCVTIIDMCVNWLIGMCAAHEWIDLWDMPRWNACGRFLCLYIHIILYKRVQNHKLGVGLLGVWKVCGIKEIENLCGSKLHHVAVGLMGVHAVYRVKEIASLCCNMLQRVSGVCVRSYHVYEIAKLCCSDLQRVAVCCSGSLGCVWGRIMSKNEQTCFTAICSVLWYVVVGLCCARQVYRVKEIAKVCCSALQRAAACCSVCCRGSLGCAWGLSCMRNWKSLLQLVPVGSWGAREVYCYVFTTHRAIASYPKPPFFPTLGKETHGDSTESVLSWLVQSANV